MKRLMLDVGDALQGVSRDGLKAVSYQPLRVFVASL